MSKYGRLQHWVLNDKNLRVSLIYARVAALTGKNTNSNLSKRCILARWYFFVVGYNSVRSTTSHPINRARLYMLYITLWSTL